MLQVSDNNETAPVQIVAGWIGRRSRAYQRRYIPWFTPEAYRRLRAILKDVGGYPPEYNKWLKACEAEERQWIAEGDTVLRTSINPEAFGRWCRKRFVKPNRKAVEVFVEEMITRSDPGAFRA